MSLPITAVGPLKVETKPILMVSPARAEPEHARLDSESAMALVSQYAVFIRIPLRYIKHGKKTRQVDDRQLRAVFARNRRPPASAKPALSHKTFGSKLANPRQAAP